MKDFVGEQLRRVVVSDFIFQAGITDLHGNNQDMNAKKMEQGERIG